MTVLGDWMVRVLAEDVFTMTLSEGRSSSIPRARFPPLEVKATLAPDAATCSEEIRPERRQNA